LINADQTEQKFTPARVWQYSFVFFVILSFVGYYLLPSSQANNFPTYVVAIMFVIDMWRSSGIRIQKTTTFRCFLILVLYLLCSVGWSEKRETREIVSLFGNAMLLLSMVMSVVRCNQYFDKFGSWLIASIVGCATLSAGYFLFVASGDLGRPPGRLSTQSVAAISYGSALVMAAFLVLKSNRPLFRWSWLACFLILGAACYQLEYNYVWLALAGSLVVISFSRVWEYGDTIYVFSWMIVATCLLVAFLYLFDMVLVSDRQLIWESVVNMVYDSRPIFGSGILTPIIPMVDCEQFPILLDSFAGCNFQHPHNLFVASLFRGGVVGLALLVILYMVSISCALESDKDEKWLVLAILSYCAVVFLFDGDHLLSKINFVWMIFWLPIAFSISLEYREMEVN